MGNRVTLWTYGTRLALVLEDHAHVNLQTSLTIRNPRLISRKLSPRAVLNDVFSPRNFLEARTGCESGLLKRRRTSSDVNLQSRGEILGCISAMNPLPLAE